MKRPRLRWSGPLVLVSALFLLLAAMAVSFAYRSGSQKTAENLPVHQIASRIDEAVFSNRQTGLQSFTRSDEISRVAMGLDAPDNPRVSMILDTARRIFDADLVYIMDRSGNVVSCTRYEGGKTLTGHSYPFRPYFTTALAGQDSVYPALGVTTGLRGLYFSTPVFGPDHAAVGVVVVKVGIGSIENILIGHDTPIFLVSPDGVIFASNRKDLLYHYVLPLTDAAIGQIQASKQFGDMALKPFPALLTGRSQVVFEDETFYVSRRTILSNWSIVALVKGGPNFVINKNVAFLLMGLFALMTAIIAILATVIHARKRAELALRESEAQLRRAHGIQSLVLVNSTVAITFVRQRVFEWVNSRLSEMLGRPEAEIQGKSTRILYGDDETFEWIGRTAYPALGRGEQFRAEFQSRRADGTPFWAQLYGKALDVACPEEGSIWIIEDITERKRTEEELKAHREHLEELVAFRTAELREAKDLAEAATQAKSVFLSSMSHELRTPLNAILGYAQLLTRTVEDPESRDNLQRIHRAGEHLLGLINHVLSLSKIEAGKLSLNAQPFPTEPFFRSLEDMTRVRTNAKGLSFRMEVQRPFPAALVGDSLKLRQVLMNLLGNALKFTERGEVVLVIERREGRVRFEVRDTGPGMSPEEVSSLFEAFHQTESGKQATEGTGLGLHISLSLVRLMGGEISVESEPGRGSRFHFELPLAEADLAPDEPAPLLGLAPGGPSLKMLVVDDVEDNRTLLSRMLRLLGMEVREAADGPEALAQWKAWQPQLVWMDLRMPGMDGLEAVRRLREQEGRLALPRTTVIALTASVLDLEARPMLEAGFDDLMAKPFPLSEILEKLHKHCGLALLHESGKASIPADSNGIATHIADLDPAWIEAFDRALLLGDREEAMGLLGALKDPALAEAFAAPLKEFQFEALRGLLARRPHV